MSRYDPELSDSLTVSSQTEVAAGERTDRQPAVFRQTSLQLHSGSHIRRTYTNKVLILRSTQTLIGSRVVPKGKAIE